MQELLEQILSNPNLQSYFGGLLYWLGQATGPVLTAFFVFLWNRALRSADDARNAIEAFVSSPARKDQSSSLSREQAADLVESFQLDLKRTIPPNTLPALKGNGQLRRLTDSFQEMKDQLHSSSDLSSVAGKDLYFERVSKMLTQMWAGKIKSRTIAGLYRSTHKPAVKLINELRGKGNEMTSDEEKEIAPVRIAVAFSSGISSFLKTHNLSKYIRGTDNY